MAKSGVSQGIDLDDISADEAFAVLGNEIRLDIVRVLWGAGAARAYDDVSDRAETMTFSELRRRVDVEDNGKFNYHLSQLVPHFVRRTEEGYRLSGAGKRIARTVIAVSGAEDIDVATDLDRECPLCDAPLRAAYEDQWLRVRCTECDGLFGDEAPPGTLYFANYPAAGLSGRSTEDALEAGLYRCTLDNTYMMHGVCRECGGRISASVTVCHEHESGHGEPCAECGTPFQVWAEQQCDVCGFAKHLPVELFALGLTPVVGFLDDLGIDALAPSFDDVVDLFRHHVETTVSEDPLRVSVAFDGEDARLTVTLDDDMEVVDLDRRPLDGDRATETARPEPVD